MGTSRPEAPNQPDPQPTHDTATISDYPRDTSNAHCLSPRSREGESEQDMLLDDVAEEINEICRSARPDLVYLVGGLVVERLFDGRIEVWAREGTSRPSYHQLATRANLLISPSALYRAVSVHALCERLGGRSAWRHARASHFQEVLPLDLEQQRLLLSSAEREQWSVGRLRAEISKRKPVRPRKIIARFAQLVSRFCALLASEKAQLLSSHTLAALDDSMAEQLSNNLKLLESQVSEIASTLRDRRQP